MRAIIEGYFMDILKTMCPQRNKQLVMLSSNVTSFDQNRSENRKKHICITITYNGLEAVDSQSHKADMVENYGFMLILA